MANNSILQKLMGSSFHVEMVIRRIYWSKITQFIRKRFVVTDLGTKKSTIINLENINNHLLKDIKIDFTFLNIVNNYNMKKRLGQRKRLNRYDKFDTKFYNKVQNGFIKLLKLKPKKYIKINSNMNIKINEKIILDKIKSLI